MESLHGVLAWFSSQPVACRWVTYPHLPPSHAPLLPSQPSGLKLRINIADTVVIRDGKLVAWFYTSRDGVVTRAPTHEVGPQAVFRKLVGRVASTSDNPNGYVAIAHYNNGVSRLLKEGELMELVRCCCMPHGEPYRTSILTHATACTLPPSPHAPQTLTRNV
eukprot:352800-Chlamydomonas_euryale.AAC.8